MKSATYYTSHFIWAKSKVLHFDSTHAGSWLREWYESDWVAIVCWQQRSYFFLEMHSLHVQRLAPCRACLFWGKCICLFWNNYYLLYCPVQSDILSFHFHTHLSDRSFACPSALRPASSVIILSRAMAASCQARPSVRIVDGRGKLRSKQLVRKLSSVDGRTFWSDCAQSTSKYISSDWIHHQTHLRRVIRWHPWTCRSNYWEWNFLYHMILQVEASQVALLVSSVGCIGWCIQLSLTIPSRPSQMNDSEHKSCVNFATGLVEQL